MSTRWLPLPRAASPPTDGVGAGRARRRSHCHVALTVVIAMAIGVMAGCGGRERGSSVLPPQADGPSLRATPLPSERPCDRLDAANPVQAAYLQQVKSRIQAYWSYPREAARQKRSGQAVVEFAWNRDGTIIMVSVRRSAGHELLDRYAGQRGQTGSSAPACSRRR